MPKIRWLMIGLCFLANAISYIDRANLAIAAPYIRAELGTHGLDRDAIAVAMDGYDGDWGENARDLVRRRFGAVAGDRTRQRKAADFLVRRGFAAEHVRLATRLDPDEDRFGS